MKYRFEGDFFSREVDCDDFMVIVKRSKKAYKTCNIWITKKIKRVFDTEGVQVFPTDKRGPSPDK